MVAKPASIERLLVRRDRTGRLRKMGNPKYVGWRTRMTVILRDRRCVYCGRSVACTTGASCKGNASWRAYDSKGNGFHFDHKRPFASGGTSGPENIVLACAKCNLSKGTANV